MGTAWSKLSLLALLSLSAIVFMGKAHETSLQAMDSAIHGRIALETVAPTGLAPSLPMGAESLGGHWGTGFNDHPFTLFWMNGLFMRTFGADSWSARFIPTLFSVGCVGLTYLLAAHLFSVGVGLFAGFILTFSIPFIKYGTRFHLDTPMIFFILLSYLFWARFKFKQAAFFSGMGVWIKNPVSFLLLPSYFFASLLSRQSVHVIRFSGYALIAVATASLVWIFTGFTGGWDLPFDYFQRQVIGTAIQGRHVDQNDPYVLWTMLRRFYYPWIFILAYAVIWFFKNRRWRNYNTSLVVCSILVCGLIISSMRFKFEHYYLPLFPFLAIFCAIPFQKFLERRLLGIQKGLTLIALTVLAGIQIFPISFGPEPYIALRKFEHIIRNSKVCDEKILVLDGDFPYGSFADYSAEILFYTGQRPTSGTCANLNQDIKKTTPTWIILSETQLSNCAGTSEYIKVLTDSGLVLLSSKAVDALPDFTERLTAPFRCGL